MVQTDAAVNLSVETNVGVDGSWRRGEVVLSMSQAGVKSQHGDRLRGQTSMETAWGEAQHGGSGR